MTRHLLEGVSRRSVELPVLPVVITTLMSLDPDDPECFNTLLDLARAEPCFAVKLLTAAGSVQAPRGGDTLEKALVRVGLSSLHRLVSEHSSARIFVPTSDEERCLWLHVIQVAVGCELLARAFPGLEVDRDKAYLAGLLHDIGRLLYYEQIARAPNEIGSTDYDSPETLLRAEEAVLGENHVALGIEACKRWPVPDYVRATVTHHHSPLESRHYLRSDERAIVELVKFADEMSVFALRRDPSDEAAYARMCEGFLATDSEFLAPMLHVPEKLIKVLHAMLPQATERYQRLKLGPIGRAAHSRTC